VDCLEIHRFHKVDKSLLPTLWDFHQVADLKATTASASKDATGLLGEALKAFGTVHIPRKVLYKAQPEKGK